MENCVFEMSVNGIYPNTAIFDLDDFVEKPDFYEMRFRIIHRFSRYEVWVFTPFTSMRCGFFDFQIDAELYINRSIKTAMLGKFLYWECGFCKEKNHYPEKMCKKCCMIIYGTDYWKIDETQNEKKSQHVGLCMIRYGSSKRSKSIVNGFKTD
jgi:hypothetical protein